MDKSAEVGDLFLSIYTNNSSTPAQTATLSSVNDVRTSLLASDQCQITRNDILVILIQTPAFRKDFYDVAEVPLSTQLSVEGSLQESCNKALYCLGWDKNQVIDTREELNDCKAIIYNKYRFNKEIGTLYLAQPVKNKNDSVYLDGNTDNAPFDLMEDMKQIRKILFDDNNPPEPPKMIYYSMPRNLANTTTSNPLAIPGAISAFWEWPATNALSNTSNPAGTPNSLDPTSVLSSSSDGAINNFINSLNEANTTPNTTVNTANTGEANRDIFPAGDLSVIQEPLCIMPTSVSSDILESTPTDISSLDELSKQQAELFDTLSGLLFQAPSANDFTSLDNLTNTIAWWTNGLNNRIVTPTPSPQALQCSLQCESKTDQVEKQLCEGNCCIQSCNNISNVGDKAICLAQCLCGEIATKNDELRIKFCSVPAQPTRIIANKTVSNIEQVVEAINSIFLYLKSNGLMTKRSKTKELMDSSFSEIKLKDILSFNIFVAFKPIYDKVSFSRMKESKKKEESNTKKSVHPAGVKLGDQKDRLRYVSLWNHAKIQASKNIYTSYNQFEDNVKDLSQIQCEQQWKIWNSKDETCDINTEEEKKISERKTYEQNNIEKMVNTTIQYAEINDNLYSFIDQNYLFREQVSRSMNAMYETSSILQSKAESAKK